MAAERDILAAGWWWPAARTEPDWDAEVAALLPRIHDFFRYRIGPGPDAEDLTAATFAKAWSGRHRYRRDVASFRTWIYAIARNVAIDHYRARRVHAPLAEAAALAAAGGPESDAERRSDAERLARLVAQLPDRDRELLALKYGAGLGHREIARATGLEESNVGTILHRCVGRLRAGWHEGETHEPR